MNIMLIRHGETDYNIEHRIYGHAQIPLNARGMTQARAVAQRLARTPLRCIYSSDLIRAYHTAQTIAAHHHIDVQVDARIREVDVGAWEHLTEADVASGYPQRYAEFRERPGDTAYFDGESFAQVQQRALQFLHHCIATHQHDDTLCIVCHAGTISALICAVLQVDINHHPRLRIDNCAITQLVVTGDSIQLSTLNDNAHHTTKVGE